VLVFNQSLTEHFLDLINADFSDEAEVDKILNMWEEKRPEAGSSHHKDNAEEDKEQTGVSAMKRASLLTEISIMFRRHGNIIVRDPILYLGRCVIFLICNTIFALVYLKARDYDQEQALNKMWVNIVSTAPCFVCAKNLSNLFHTYILFYFFLRNFDNLVYVSLALCRVISKSGGSFDYLMLTRIILTLSFCF
jgi:hypothetical protein